MQVHHKTGYSGPERRRSVTVTDIRPYSGRLIVAALVILAAWCSLVLLVGNRPDSAHQALIGLTRALAGGLLLSAAGLRFATWRITGTARAALSVVALMVAGFAFPVVGMISYLPGTGSITADPTPIARALVEFALIGFGVAALVSPAVVSRLRPLRLAAPFLAGCLAISAVIAVRGPAARPEPVLTGVTLAVQWSTAMLWIGLAVAFLLRGRRYCYRPDQLVGVGLGVIALASLTRAVLGHWHFARMAAPAGGQLCVAVLVAGVSALALWQVQTGRGTRLLKVAGDLQGAQTDLAEAERDQARRLHDARSAILAVSGATRILAYPESHSGVDPERLHRLVSAELARLGSLLDPGFRSSVRSFRPAEVIEPLILAHRMAGARIDTDITNCSAVGRPEATATAVANLLSNARMHAAGARIWVSVIADEMSVAIRVADDGPGIPAADRRLVVQRGVRGRHAAGEGSGIGLAAAAEAMSDQGGTLLLGERPEGGTVITLTLRRDRRRTAPEPHQHPGTSSTIGRPPAGPSLHRPHRAGGGAGFRMVPAPRTAHHDDRRADDAVPVRAGQPAANPVESFDR